MSSEQRHDDSAAERRFVTIPPQRPEHTQISVLSAVPAAPQRLSIPLSLLSICRKIRHSRLSGGLCDGARSSDLSSLECPDCGGTMETVALIGSQRQPEVIEKILTAVRQGGEYEPFGLNRLCLLPFPKHCRLRREPTQRGPPAQTSCPPEPAARVLTYDAGFPATFVAQCMAAGTSCPVGSQCLHVDFRVGNSDIGVE